ncbi:MAG: TetR/AcrR family transcriptional regulator [Candidatus Izemoplasmatales bacterium]|nr:TetR/AcrR family transcriptional regulator [Candidatus Izemoplasmatales bacterium]MDD4355295.1 TetR/AcrR family transcriptional regulator [Candidatus Izemoplasmatales bacterium]MDD4987952.1 TetR/AcrR family transcriptional regulator [Candidatus Izemoplasmatales bacterium]MDD5601470.1 TetR/AcrR family transcriptional regulator [Candidatus Izemoplasmatales bacterium]MDY0373375.1 TetR/AcrR family transcriptional regulator [Candidatus Izemoplasmatales bacterium]
MNAIVSTKEKIIEAALSVFSDKGFDLASTNDIYRIAGVSKGLIFKIFGTKAELYFQVFEHALNHLLNELNTLDLSAYSDPIDRVVAVIFWKLKYANQFPIEAKFLLEGVLSPPPEILERFQHRLSELRVFSIRFCFENASLSSLSPEYSREEFYDYIEYAVMGIQEKLMQIKPKLEEFEPIRNQSIRFLKALMKGMEK